jgi:agmatine deiminase
MITDRETNFVYVSDLLKVKCNSVFTQLMQWFHRLEIGFSTLMKTKDLWVVDFMPLQIKEDHFVQFTYDPDYLKPMKYQNTKTDSHEVCNLLDIAWEKSEFQFVISYLVRL